MMRKRNLTTYQNLFLIDLEDQDSQNDQNKSIQNYFSAFEQQKQQNSIKNPEKQKNLKPQKKSNITSLGLIKSQKTKIHEKFQNIKKQKTKLSNQQSFQLSTIESLKKDILAIQNDQIASYRLKTIRNQTQTKKQDETVNNYTSKIKIFHKEFITDKFRRKITSLNSKIRQFDQIREKVGLSINNQEKVKSARNRYLQQKSRVSTPITAIKFYRPQTRCNSARIYSTFSLSQKQGTIKKLTLKTKMSQNSSKSLMNI